MDEHSMMSDFDFKALPPLPDSPVTTKAFPSSPFQIRSRYAQDLESNDALSMPRLESETTLAQHAHTFTARSSPAKQTQTQTITKTQTARIPSSESQTSALSDNYLPTSFLLRSPSKHLSPAKIPLPPFPTRPTYALLPSPTRSSTHEGRLAPSPAPPSGDQSFLMPQTRFRGRDSDSGMNLSQSMIGDTSMPDLMSLENDESLEFGPGLGGGLGTARDVKNGARTEISPAKVGGVRRQEHDSSPIRRERSPIKVESTRSRAYPTPYTRSARSPTRSNPSTSPSKTKRTFPASSSHNLLSRLGEKAALDVSTIFPRSPTRMEYLMGDEHQLLRQSLPMSEGEGDTILFAPSPPVVSRRTPRKASPIKDSDLTLDVGQMMARIGKPKRPSGTEESFEDLLHGSVIDLDDVMTGNILPPDLRPRTKSLGTHFQARTTSASVKTLDLPKSPSRSPIKDTTRALLPSTSNRHQSNPSKPHDSPRRHMTPGRTVPERTAVPHPPSARRLAQAPSTRRPSLSAGAVPMPSTASYSKMESPKPAAARQRTRSAKHPADVISGQRHIGLARPASERELFSKAAIPTARFGMTAGSAKITSMLPPARSATIRPGSSRPGSSALPPTTTRTTAPASRLGLGSMAPPARPASFRPTSMAPPAKSSLPPTSTRLAVPSTTVPPRSGLTRPSASTTRTFGADGTAQTNRNTTTTIRPTNFGGLPAKSTTTRAIPGKMSMAPPSSPSKRDTTSAMKSRAASTPSETVVRSLVRPTTTKSSIPPIASGSRLTSGTSALPRPPTSRLPAPGSRLSSGAGGSTAAGGRGTTSIAALRARIDEISARQAASRRA